MKYIIIIMFLVLSLTAPTFSQSEELKPLWQGIYSSLDIDFSPDGEILAIGNNDNKAYLVDPLTGEVQQELEHSKEWVNQVKFTHNGEYLITSNHYSIITLWDTQTWEIVNEIEFADEFNDKFVEFKIFDLAITKDDRYLIIAGGEVGLIKLNLEDFSKSIKNDNGVYHVSKGGWPYTSRLEYVSLSYDDRHIMASIPILERVHIYDFETLEEVKRYDDVHRGEFSPTRDEFFTSVNRVKPNDILREAYIYKNGFDNFTHKLNYSGQPSYSKHGNYLVYNDRIRFIKNSTLEQEYTFLDNNDGRPWASDGNYFNFQYDENLNIVSIGGKATYTLDHLLSIEHEIVNEFSISPNPANELVNIEYDFINPSEYTLSLSDVTGNQLAIIDSGYHSGNYQFQYGLNDLPNGTYFITLQINDSVLTKQFIKE